MATISKIKAFNAFYGYSAYSNSAAVHMYVGAQSESTKYDYRSRITLPPLSQAEGVEGGRIRVNRMTLHLRQLAGKNSHHIIEAASKACARALRQAVETDPRIAGQLPSTKGSL
jgi:hypothetical protein